jgi:hypothetical protein
MRPFITTMSEEFSEGGQPIYRHSNPEQPEWIPADMSGSSMEMIDQHIQAHIGKVENVFHEVLSDIVHIDVHVVPPTPDRFCYTLITSGMSDLPMNTPAGLEHFRYAELMLCLPALWPMGNDAFKLPENYWPIRGLKMLARFPHQYKTWLGFGHTLPNGNPQVPFASNTKLDGWMLAHPLTVSKDFWKLQAGEDKLIWFYSPLPLYPDEMELKLKTNAQTIIAGFEKSKYSELINPTRKSILSKPWWKF